MSESDLKILGAKGWKLVNHSVVTDGYHVQQYYIFMR